MQFAFFNWLHGSSVAFIRAVGAKLESSASLFASIVPWKPSLLPRRVSVISTSSLIETLRMMECEWVEGEGSVADQRP